MSKLVSQSWTLPAFSILAASIFITVHMTSGAWKEKPVLAVQTGREGVPGGGGGLMIDGEGLKPFTYTPTMAPNTDLQYVPVPTVMVVGHNVPQIVDIVPTYQPGPTDKSPLHMQWNIPLGEPTP